MRLVVSQPQLAVADGSPCGPIPVGIAAWRGPEDLFAFVVKLTFTFQRGAEGVEVAALCEEQAPLALDRPNELPGAREGELAYASDFRLYRPRCDVLLFGHAHALQPVNGVDAAIRVGALERRFQVVSQDAATRLPLVRTALRDPSQSDYACAPVGPLSVPYEDTETWLEHVDFAKHQYATFDQQLDELAPDALIELTGLSARGPVRRIQLPGLVPQLHVDGGLYGEGLARLRCDTLFIDTDAERIECVWRAVSPVKRSSLDAIGDMLISIERAGSPRPPDELVKSLCRGVFHYAVYEDDVVDGAPELDESALTFARLRARAPQPDPLITLEQYAQISAELAEQRQPRGAILERHGLDADAWSLEERGWMGRMSDAAMNGDPSLSTQFSTLYLAAQSALADPNEEAVTMETYAEIKVTMENGASQGQVLRARQMSVTAWIRIDNRFSRAAREDAAVKRELERAMERARAALHGKTTDAEEATT